MKKKNKSTNRFESKELKKSSYMNEDMKKVITFIVVLIVVMAFILLLFFLNGKYVTKDEFQTSTTTTTTVVSYDETIITVDELFSQNEKEYMVLLYDGDDELTNFLYSGLITSYSGDTTLYSIDLANKMNANHYDKSGEANKNPKTSDDVMVTGPTLITIKKGKVTSYITDKDEIKDKLTVK